MSQPLSLLWFLCAYLGSSSLGPSGSLRVVYVSWSSLRVRNVLIIGLLLTQTRVELYTVGLLGSALLESQKLRE
jgi:hypothetical protein